MHAYRLKGSTPPDAPGPLQAPGKKEPKVATVLRDREVLAIAQVILSFARTYL
jgi:hypothetical protein